MVRKEKKPEIVQEVSEKLKRSQIAIVTDYRGLTVSQMTDLRRRLRKQGIEYQVVKNTLAGMAADQVGKSGLLPYLEGPTAIAFGFDNPADPPKVLLEFQKTGEDVSLKIKGGILGERPLTAQEVSTIAKLPSKEELVGRLMGQLQAPITGLVTVLNGNLRGLVTVLQGRVTQMNEGG